MSTLLIPFPQTAWPLIVLPGHTVPCSQTQVHFSLITSAPTLALPEPSSLKYLYGPFLHVIQRSLSREALPNHLLHHSVSLSLLYFFS